MESLQVLKLNRKKRGGSFLSKIGRFARPYIRSMIKVADPLVRDKLRSLGMRALSRGSQMVTEAVVDEIKDKLNKGGKSRRKKKNIKRRVSRGAGLVVKRKKSKSKNWKNLSGGKKKKKRGRKRHSIF